MPFDGLQIVDLDEDDVRIKSSGLPVATIQCCPISCYVVDFYALLSTEWKRVHPSDTQRLPIKVLPSCTALLNDQHERIP